LRDPDWAGLAARTATGASGRRAALVEAAQGKAGEAEDYLLAQLLEGTARLARELSRHWRAAIAVRRGRLGSAQLRGTAAMFAASSLRSLAHWLTPELRIAGCRRRPPPLGLAVLVLLALAHLPTVRVGQVALLGGEIDQALDLKRAPSYDMKRIRPRLTAEIML
jgi:AcrR family transcriptional regulator